MRKSRAALLGAVAASLALIGGGATVAYAQSRTAAASQGGQVIEVPPGAVVIVLPPGSLLGGGAAMPLSPFSAASTVPVMPSLMMPMMLAGPGAGTGVPFALPPDVVAMMRRANQMLDQMMEDAHGGFAYPAWIGPDRTIEAALQGMPRPLGRATGSVQGVVVTSFSDGHGTCTQRVIYGGDGAAPPRVEVSSTGNACATSEAAPMAAPMIRTPPQRHVAPRMWQVDYRPRQPAWRRPAAPLEVAQIGN